MVGRYLDENEHVTDSTWARLTENKGSSRQISNIRHVSKVVIRACNKNFAQHLLSYPPATNGDKRNLGGLRYSCQRAPEQSINTSWIHGILKL